MQRLIIFAIVGILLLATGALSGCGLTFNIGFATPSITPLIATSLPISNTGATETPSPAFSLATNTATSTAAAQATRTTAPTASATVQLPTPTQTQPPPPPPPTKVALIQLPVFDKDGNNMDGSVMGISVPKSSISFQVITCIPDCKSKPDGTGVTSVDFAFFKLKTQKRDDLQGKTPVYKTTEHNKPYCAFGGDSPCPLWIFSEHGGKWPNGANIESGDYTLLLTAHGDNKNNGFWTSVVNFSIQR